MPILVLGLNYKSAPVGLLERVAVPADRLPKALASLMGRDHVLEAVALSTCNRVEVYADVSRFHGGLADLRNFFAEWGGLALEDFVDLAYDLHEERAAAHLFAVSSGLDSMVVGERQIHLQVKQAFRQAQEEGACGRMLGRLFRQALQVGRRARTETGISQGASSMVDVGLAAAERVLGDLDGRTVLVVGAGKIGSMGTARLAERAGRVLVTNRTPERALRLANGHGAETLPFSELSRGLAVADLVLTTTGASTPIIDVDRVEEVIQSRADRALVFLDLAVPRDVEPSCGGLPGVTVLDIDAVRDLATEGMTGAEAVKVLAIVEEEAAAYASWTRTVGVGPTIAALHAKAEAVRQAELARLGGRLGDLDERQAQALDALTRGILNTLLHDPSVRLKDAADAGRAEAYAAALRELFDLPDA